MAVQMMSRKITKTYQEHAIFEDMMPLEGLREPSQEEDSVNQGESQRSRNDENEAGKEESNSHESREIAESISQEDEARSEESSCDSS